MGKVWVKLVPKNRTTVLTKTEPSLARVNQIWSPSPFSSLTHKVRFTRGWTLSFAQKYSNVWRLGSAASEGISQIPGGTVMIMFPVTFCCFLGRHWSNTTWKRSLNNTTVQIWLLWFCLFVRIRNNFKGHRLRITKAN